MTLNLLTGKWGVDKLNIVLVNVTDHVDKIYSSNIGDSIDKRGMTRIYALGVKSDLRKNVSRCFVRLLNLERLEKWQRGLTVQGATALESGLFFSESRKECLPFAQKVVTSWLGITPESEFTKTKCISKSDVYNDPTHSPFRFDDLEIIGIWEYSKNLETVRELKGSRVSVLPAPLDHRQKSFNCTIDGTHNVPRAKDRSSSFGIISCTIFSKGGDVTHECSNSSKGFHSTCIAPHSLTNVNKFSKTLVCEQCISCKFCGEQSFSPDITSVGILICTKCGVSCHNICTDPPEIQFEHPWVCRNCRFCLCCMDSQSESWTPDWKLCQKCAYKMSCAEFCPVCLKTWDITGDKVITVLREFTLNGQDQETALKEYPIGALLDQKELVSTLSDPFGMIECERCRMWLHFCCLTREEVNRLGIKATLKDRKSKKKRKCSNSMYDADCGTIESQFICRVCIDTTLRHDLFMKVLLLQKSSYRFLNRGSCPGSDLHLLIIEKRLRHREYISDGCILWDLERVLTQITDVSISAAILELRDTIRQVARRILMFNPFNHAYFFEKNHVARARETKLPLTDGTSNGGNAISVILSKLADFLKIIKSGQGDLRVSESRTSVGVVNNCQISRATGYIRSLDMRTSHLQDIGEPSGELPSPLVITPRSTHQENFDSSRVFCDTVTTMGSLSDWMSNPECVMCLSSGNGLIVCKGCAEHFHFFCIGMNHHDPNLIFLCRICCSDLLISDQHGKHANHIVSTHDLNGLVIHPMFQAQEHFNLTLAGPCEFCGLLFNTVSTSSFVKDHENSSNSTDTRTPRTFCSICRFNRSVSPVGESCAGCLYVYQRKPKNRCLICGRRWHRNCQPDRIHALREIFSSLSLYPICDACAWNTPRIKYPTLQFPVEHSGQSRFLLNLVLECLGPGMDRILLLEVGRVLGQILDLFRAGNRHLLICLLIDSIINSPQAGLSRQRESTKNSSICNYDIHQHSLQHAREAGGALTLQGSISHLSKYILDLAEMRCQAAWWFQYHPHLEYMLNNVAISPQERTDIVIGNPCGKLFESMLRQEIHKYHSSFYQTRRRLNNRVQFSCFLCPPGSPLSSSQVSRLGRLLPIRDATSGFCSVWVHIMCLLFFSRRETIQTTPRQTVEIITRKYQSSGVGYNGDLVDTTDSYGDQWQRKIPSPERCDPHPVGKRIYSPSKLKNDNYPLEYEKRNVTTIALERNLVHSSYPYQAGVSSRNPNRVEHLTRKKICVICLESGSDLCQCRCGTNVVHLICAALGQSEFRCGIGVHVDSLQIFLGCNEYCRINSFLVDFEKFRRRSRSSIYESRSTHDVLNDANLQPVLASYKSIEHVSDILTQPDDRIFNCYGVYGHRIGSRVSIYAPQSSNVDSPRVFGRTFWSLSERCTLCLYILNWDANGLITIFNTTGSIVCGPSEPTKAWIQFAAYFSDVPMTKVYLDSTSIEKFIGLDAFRKRSLHRDEFLDSIVSSWGDCQFWLYPSGFGVIFKEATRNYMDALRRLFKLSMLYFKVPESPRRFMDLLMVDLYNLSPSTPRRETRLAQHHTKPPPIDDIPAGREEFPVGNRSGKNSFLRMSGRGEKISSLCRLRGSQVVRSTLSQAVNARDALLYAYHVSTLQNHYTQNIIGSHPITKVMKSRISGLGLSVTADIMAGTILCEYTGEIIRHSLANQLENLSEVMVPCIHCYMFQVNDFFIVDAASRGNCSRFINHSCFPTCFCEIHLARQMSSFQNDRFGKRSFGDVNSLRPIGNGFKMNKLYPPMECPYGLETIHFPSADVLQNLSKPTGGGRLSLRKIKARLDPETVCEQIFIRSKRDMIAGDEITINYQFTMDKEKNVCQCESMVCTGWMG